MSLVRKAKTAHNCLGRGVFSVLIEQELLGDLWLHAELHPPLHFDQTKNPMTAQLNVVIQLTVLSL